MCIRSVESVTAVYIALPARTGRILPVVHQPL